MDKEPKYKLCQKVFIITDTGNVKSVMITGIYLNESDCITYMVRDSDLYHTEWDEENVFTEVTEYFVRRKATLKDCFDVEMSKLIRDAREHGVNLD